MWLDIARIIICSVVAVVAVVCEEHQREIQHQNQNCRRKKKKCAICNKELLEDSPSNHFSTSTTRRLGCSDLFHSECIECYVHAHRGCKVKCPDPDCEAPLTNLDRGKFDDLFKKFKYNSFFCIFCKKVLRQSYVPNYIVLSCKHQFCRECLRTDFEIHSFDSPETQWMCPLTDCKTPIDEQTVSKLKALEELNR